jgi:predicted NAD/FAD-dependent oxidoreductase
MHRALLFCLLLASVGSAGCGASEALAEKFQTGMEAARDIQTASMPCLVATKAAELEACKDDPACENRVQAFWAAGVEKAVDILHGLWCGVRPDSQGCP